GDLVAGALLAALAPRVVDEDLSHHLRRQGEEAAAVADVEAAGARQPQPRLVDQRRGLQRVLHALARHRRAGQLAQLGVELLDALVERLAAGVGVGGGHRASSRPHCLAPSLRTVAMRSSATWSAATAVEIPSRFAVSKTRVRLR